MLELEYLLSCIIITEANPKTTTTTSTFQDLHFFHSTAVNKNSLLTKSKLSDKGFSESKERLAHLSSSNVTNLSLHRLIVAESIFILISNVPNGHKG